MPNNMEMLRIFVVTAESLNFRDAANRLGTSPQKVTRAIKLLEQAFAEPLFHRSTRQVQITAFGADLAHQAQEMLQRFDEMFTSNQKFKNGEIEGRVGITAPHAVGKRYLSQYLAPLMRANPALRIELSLDDELTDAVAARVDIGIRIGAVRDSRFVARTVAEVPLRIFAAPSLISSVGTPADLEELKMLPMSVLIDRNNGRPWPWFFSEGGHFLPPFPAFTCDDPETELEFILGGLAFGQMPLYLAEPYLSTGRLVEVLRGIAPENLELIIYRTQSGLVPPRVRLVYDHIVAQFADSNTFPQT